MNSEKQFLEMQEIEERMFVLKRRYDKRVQRFADRQWMLLNREIGELMALLPPNYEELRQVRASYRELMGRVSRKKAS